MTIEESTFTVLLKALPQLRHLHARNTPVYDLLNRITRSEAELRFGPESSGPQSFGQFGDIHYPHFAMGTRSSTDLVALDELFIFSYYWANRHKYCRVADLGTNTGIHTIIMDRCGFEVRAFEPDAVHFKQLEANLAANECQNVTATMKAVSTSVGEVEFVRVLGNTTGSHIAGSKTHPYGELDRVTVSTADIAEIMSWADLIKIDIEGHERQVLLATHASDWEGTDAFVEVGTTETASALFNHFQSEGVNMFSQKLNWSKATRADDVPASYLEGSLFLSTKEQMSWGGQTH